MKYYICSVKPRINDVVGPTHKVLNEKILPFPLKVNVIVGKRVSLNNEYGGKTITSPVLDIILRDDNDKEFHYKKLSDYKGNYDEISTIEVETKNSVYHFFGIGPYEPIEDD